jgi:hypothetical protein
MRPPWKVTTEATDTVWEFPGLPLPEMKKSLVGMGTPVAWCRETGQWLHWKFWDSLADEKRAVSLGLASPWPQYPYPIPKVQHIREENAQ